MCLQIGRKLKDRKVSVRRIDRWFRVGQLFSAAAYSLGHGGNDAQKTMGIITIVLVAGGFLQLTPAGKLPDIPRWVDLHWPCAAAMLEAGVMDESGEWLADKDLRLGMEAYRERLLRAR